MRNIALKRRYLSSPKYYLSITDSVHSLFAQNPDKPGIVNPNYVKNIPGLEALDSADMMIIFTRFRALPDEQMQHFRIS